MPVVRPFRALRYDTDVVGDLGRVVAPPYDVIDAVDRERLLARSPYNVVRLDFPSPEDGDTDPNDRYRRAARLLGSWRGNGAIRRDPRPSIYVYEQRFRRPGGVELEQRRGFFARVGIEPFGDGVLPHERTLPGPREDRYRLLRATNVNTSPVVSMYRDATGGVPALLDAIAAGPPRIDIVDAGGEGHRLWELPGGTDGRAERLADLAGAATLTIADGHHRYETALRFQAERVAGTASAPDAEAGYNFVLMLLLEPEAGPVVVLPTHRVVRGIDVDGRPSLADRLAGLYAVRGGLSAHDLIAAFGAGGSGAPAEGGRIGLWMRDGGSILTADRAAFARLPMAGGAAVRRLDVSLLGATLESVLGVDAGAVAGGEHITYTKDAAEAIAMVDDRVDRADAAFLLDPTPAADILAVAADGDVMPQKSTYIYPKAITGLVINPLEG